MAKECVFCNIADEPERILRRTALITSFLSSPRMPVGHTLIVPNRHIVRPSELRMEEMVAIHSEVGRVTEIMLGRLSMKGVDVWQKTRPEVPEGAVKQDHLHVHVLPSMPGQVLYEHAINWSGDDWIVPTAEELAEGVNVVGYGTS